VSNFTAQDVKRLRDATGAGMMDAKRALTETDGDEEKAASWLREKGLGKAAERTDRENAQGAVAVATAGNAAAVVELKSETDFVARSPEFIALLDELAQLVAEKGEDAVSEKSSAVDDLKIKLKENIEIGRAIRFDAAPGNVLDAYLHAPSGPPALNAVLIELEGGTPELAHNIALHISFARPGVVSRDEFTADAIEKERQAIEAETRNEGKPEQAWPKIIEGKLNGWYKRTPGGALLDQEFVHPDADGKQTVQSALGDAKVVRFAQVEVGG
jgi:elongation factor Ts